MNMHNLLAIVADAFRKNLVPGLFLQFFALSICLAYYFWLPSRPVFDFFADLKQAHGAVYSFFSTSVFGAVIPFIYLYLAGKIKRDAAKYLAFTAVFWAVKGVEMDGLYHLQAWLFGAGSDFFTVAKKTLFDQLVYVPFWAVPSLTVAMLWPSNDFSWWLVKKELNRELVTVKIPVILISNMIIWLPAVTVVYLMPPALQIPVSNLTLCFFVLILAVLTKNSD